MPGLPADLVGELASRYELGNSPDWQALLTHFQLGEGFAFIVLLVSNDDGAELCRADLNRRLQANDKKVVLVPVSGPADLKNIAQILLDLDAPADAGATWVARVVPQGAPEFSLWREAWRDGVMRLNQLRNPLRRHFNIPLIFAGAPWLQEVLRESAPDLWSVRTLVARVEPNASRGGTRSDFTLDISPHGPDPDLALAEANRLRGRPGKELLLARLLHRAGLGFAARYQWQDAAGALAEALKLRESAGADANDQADSAFELGKALIRLSDYDHAVNVLSKARALYERAAKPLGEANCADRLGDIALRRSDHRTALARYEEALPLYRRIGDVPGEAGCTYRLGLTALLRSDHETARARFEEALPLYRRIGSVLGEANCLNGVGVVALDRSDHGTARARFEEALAIYRRAGSVLGEANCILSFGEIALRHSDYETAHARYEEALRIYRRIGNLQGEANCIRGLGDIDTSQGDSVEARDRYHAAIALYSRIPEPYSIGTTYQRLARIGTDPKERDEYVAAARKAWESIGRQDLIADLEREFLK